MFKYPLAHKNKVPIIKSGVMSVKDLNSNIAKYNIQIVALMNVQVPTGCKNKLPIIKSGVMSVKDLNSNIAKNSNCH